MRRVRCAVVRLLVVGLVAGAVVVPGAPPAAAHGRLPTGKYECWYYPGGMATYSYFDLYIRPNNRYVYKLGDERVGRAGRFRHASGSPRIRFRSGYFASEGIKGRHERSANGHTVRLTVSTPYGPEYYYCED